MNDVDDVKDDDKVDDVKDVDNVDDMDDVDNRISPLAFLVWIQFDLSSTPSISR